MGEKDEFEPENRNKDPMNYHQAGISLEWRYGGVHLANAQMDLSPVGNPITICKGDIMDSSSCSASMVETLGPTHWDHPASLQSLGFYDNVQNCTGTSNTEGVRRTGNAASLRTGIDFTLDVGWNPPSTLLKGDIFLPNPHGLLPHGLSQFPDDPGFIERAARFSCFGSGNFSDMVNPYMSSESMVHYSRGGRTMQEAHGIFAATSFNSVSGGKSQKDLGETSADVSLSVGVTEGIPLKKEMPDGQQKSHEVKEGVGGSGHESDEAEFSSGGGGQEDPSMLEGTYTKSSQKVIGMKKRKRSGQNADNYKTKTVPDQPGEGANDTAEIQHKKEATSATNNKTTGKNGKQGSQASDPSKEEYIHIRARRGQATNSHSLAERVRREKISERMKFLQDLVPSCSKVTGKAVMLDEIINYVQSLQRQVEFLSMKLATVNPQLDFNIQRLSAKDILKSSVGASTSVFPPDMPMTHPPSLSSQPGCIQAGLPGMGTTSDILRTISMTGGFKDPIQVPRVWNDELHNVVQMSFGTDVQNIQDLNGNIH